VVAFTGIHFSTPWQQVLSQSERMLGAQWFRGARLNFARELLRHDTDKLALIYHDENGARSTISYAQLNQTVRRLAWQLKALGVGVGDRVAGYLPNRPETIMAMLATTSLGAIWSSCSPDFGYHGVFDRLQQITPTVLFGCEHYHYNGKTHSTLATLVALQGNLPSLQHVILIPNEPDQAEQASNNNFLLFNELTNYSEVLTEFVELPFDHPVYILFSSGTTGAPKGITHGAGGTLLQHLKELQLHTDLRPEDTITYFTTCGWMMWNWLVSPSVQPWC
jgi:acetoacetyl-CoA synthetase